MVAENSALMSLKGDELKLLAFLLMIVQATRVRPEERELSAPDVIKREVLDLPVFNSATWVDHTSTRANRRGVAKSCPNWEFFNHG